MNAQQRIVFLVGLAVMAVMAMVPPWMHTEPGEAAKPMGYSALWRPPTIQRSEKANIFGIKLEIGLESQKANQIDWQTLLAQGAVVALVTGGVIFLLGSGRKLAMG